MDGTASVGGLVSGIDTNSILDQLYQLAQAPVRRLEERKSKLSEQSLAWSQFEAELIALRTIATQLARPAAFQACAATTSHPDLVTATASSGAVPGTYTFTVQQLAQTHQKISGGYADLSETEFGVGTVSIAVGEADPTVIQTEGLTLAELRDAINAASAGVQAAIINDGSGATPYRLIITSETSGLAGQMAVTSDGGAPTFTDLQAAQDAQLQLGSGSVTITSSSNTISGAIPGVTLHLWEADGTTPVTLTVTRDTATVQDQIEDFVEAYNSITDFFTEQFHYDPDTGQAGALFADFRLQSLQQQLAAAVANPVVGITGGLSALAQLGIRTDATGHLLQDTGLLAATLASDLEAVARVFAAVGQTSHTAVIYLAATAETRPSGSAGWAVEVTQAARQAQVTAGVAQTDTLLADETLTIQGVQIVLSAGMTADEVVAAINEHRAETGVVATRLGGSLTLTRSAYGSALHIEAVSNRSNQGGSGSRTSGIGNVVVTDEHPEGESGGGTGHVGLDVQGTIGGEPATGSGQMLTAAEGDPEGLSLLLTADSPGSYGHVIFTVGAAEAALRVALAASDSVSGAIVTSQQRIEDLISDMDEEIARLQALIEQEQARLRASFLRMERALGQFQTQSQLLASQLALMQSNAAGSGP